MRNAKWTMAAVTCLALIGVAGLSDPLTAQTKKEMPKAKTDTKAEPKTATPAGPVFEVYKDKGGKFRFRFKVGDTELAMSHIGYEKKEDVIKVIDSIKTEAGKGKVTEAIEK